VCVGGGLSGIVSDRGGGKNTEGGYSRLWQTTLKLRSAEWRQSSNVEPLRYCGGALPGIVSDTEYRRGGKEDCGRVELLGSLWESPLRYCI